MKRVRLAVLAVVALLLVAGVAAGCGSKHHGQRECVISAPALQLQAYVAKGSSSASGSSSSSSGGSRGSSGSSSSGRSGSTAGKGNSGSGTSLNKGSSGTKGNSSRTGSSSVPTTRIPRSTLGYTGGKTITRGGRSYTVTHNHYYVPVGSSC